MQAGVAAGKRGLAARKGPGGKQGKVSLVSEQADKKGFRWRGNQERPRERFPEGLPGKTPPTMYMALQQLIDFQSTDE